MTDMDRVSGRTSLEPADVAAAKASHGSADKASSIGQPLRLPNGVWLRNRLVKSAMSEALADPCNDPTDSLIDLFGRWSRSGAALLITGHTPVDRWHLEHAGNVVLDPRSDREKTARLAAAAKSGGALALVQLAHAGRQTPQAINPRPLSLSNRRLELPGYAVPRAADEAELTATVGQFAQSARLAEDAGFDGVEIHSAHGYLLSSALSPRVNRRRDAWGGSLEKRARLLLNVVRAVRAATAPGFVVAVKLNSADFQKGGFSHADSLAVAKMLQAEDIDLLEISGGTFEAPTAYQHRPTAASSRAREAYFLDYARDIKASLEVPVMVTGGFRSLSVMNRALAEGASDLIGMGRPFIADPAFPAKLLTGAIDRAPAPEWDFPAAADLPRGAALNWFSHQLFLQGTKGDWCPEMSIQDGHEYYLAAIQSAGERLLAARRTWS